MNILFVCTGNTCRSPMAEAILKAANLPNVDVRSAGVAAMDGAVMSPHAYQIVTERQYPHTVEAAQVTPELLKWAHYVLTMTTSHRDHLHTYYPEWKQKVMTLSQFVETEEEVSDPYGGTLNTYVATFQQLQRLIDDVIVRLREDDAK